MDQLTELSRRMGTCTERGILSPYSIRDAAIKKLCPEDPGYLHICSYELNPQQIRARMIKNDPLVILSSLNPNPSEITKSRLELQEMIAQTQILREASVNPPTVKVITFDLILSIKKAGLIPRDFKLRYWIPYKDNSTIEAFVFLDYGQDEVDEKKDTRFHLVQRVFSPIEVSHREVKFHDNSEFSNLDILMAYAQNLQEGIKK